MSGTTYDIQPAFVDIAAIVRNALKPAFLNDVYEDIPDLASVTPPYMFFDYVGTALNENLTYLGSTRILKIDFVCMVGLSKDLTLTDQRQKDIVGRVYDLFATRANRTLNGNCAECRIVGDDTQAVTLLGRQVMECLTFHAEITDYITLQNQDC